MRRPCPAWRPLGTEWPHGAPSARSSCGARLRRVVQRVQTIVPVAVPVRVASGKLTGLPEMVQLTGPGAVALEATLVKVPNGEVKVRSKLTGRNSPR